LRCVSSDPGGGQYAEFSIEVCINISYFILVIVVIFPSEKTMSPSSLMIIHSMVLFHKSFFLLSTISVDNFVDNPLAWVTNL